MEKEHFKPFTSIVEFSHAVQMWSHGLNLKSHHASKFAIIYINGGHFGFNYTHASLKQKNPSFISSYTGAQIALGSVFEKYIMIWIFSENKNMILTIIHYLAHIISMY